MFRPHPSPTAQGTSFSCNRTQSLHTPVTLSDIIIKLLWNTKRRKYLSNVQWNFITFPLEMIVSSRGIVIFNSHDLLFTMLACDSQLVLIIHKNCLEDKLILYFFTPLIAFGFHGPSTQDILWIFVEIDGEYSPKRYLSLIISLTDMMSLGNEISLKFHRKKTALKFHEISPWNFSSEISFS